MMTRPTVYLSGTITTDPKYIKWRHYAVDKLGYHGIEGISPLRGKTPTDWAADGLSAKNGVIYDKGSFVARDRRDVERCDAMLLFFAEAPDRQSIGTWVELGWAIILNKPVVVCSTLPEVVKHPFVWKHAAKVCDDLDEGIAYTQFLLTP